MVEAGRDRDSSTVPAENSSGWTINWTGALLLLLVATVVVIGWRWLSSDTDERVDRAVSTTSEPAGVGEQAAPPTTAPRSTTTTRPTSSTAPSSTTTVASERRVLITGEMKPCRYGSNCLAASFTIEGFETHPGEFVCVYPNSRTTLGFGDDDVVDACLTGDAGDTITIEVEGVRSATISERNLDGTEPSD